MKLPADLVSGQETWSEESGPAFEPLELGSLNLVSGYLRPSAKFEVARGRGQWSGDVVRGVF